jgi:peroxiredoxin
LTFPQQNLERDRSGKNYKIIYGNRYAMLIENGKIEKQFVESKPGDLKVSNAAEVLKHL